MSFLAAELWFSLAVVVVVTWIDCHHASIKRGALTGASVVRHYTRREYESVKDMCRSATGVNDSDTAILAGS